MPVKTKGNQEAVNNAFSAQSVDFDKIYWPNKIVSLSRDRIRQIALGLLPEQGSILEINAGTGEDALFFASKGFQVVATDQSPEMLNQLKQKKDDVSLSVKQVDFHSLTDHIDQKFDLIFSNHGGLNCTHRLDEVIRQFPKLLKPNGHILMAIMPPTSIWEWRYLFKGRFSLAFRRFRKKGTKSHISGHYFKTYYYSPGRVKRMLSGFKIKGVEAFSLIVPPESLESKIKNPKTLHKLNRMEMQIARWPFFRGLGDYFFIWAQLGR